MCMTIHITITVGTGGDNERIIKKLKLKLNRAKIAATTTRNRNGSATLATKDDLDTTATNRMRTHAQAETIITSFIPRQRPRITKGQVKLIVVTPKIVLKPKVENNTRENNEEE